MPWLNFYRGFKVSASIALGYVPGGITFGLVATLSGWSPWEAVLASALIFAGGSQFALVSVPSSYGALVVPLFLNLRHVVYSLCVAEKLRLRKAYYTAFGLTDEVFALIQRAPDEHFVQGLEFGAYLSWVLGTALGTFGYRFFLPYKTLMGSLFFALVSLFFLLLLPNLHAYGTVAAFVGGAIALFFHILGYNSLGILLAGFLSPITVLFLKRRRCP